MEQVDADHSLQRLSDGLGERPGAFLNIKIEGCWHDMVQALVADPCVDAGAMVRIRIACLPDQVWEPLLKTDGMFTTAAGQFQHGP